MTRPLTALVLCGALASGGCAHKQLTNKQVAIGIGVVVGLSLLLYLAISQFAKFGILIASTVSAIAGLLVLLTAPRRA